MIHRLPITTAQDTPVDKIHPSTPQIVTCRILSHTTVHTKKETHLGALTFQTPFQEKMIGKGLLNLL